MTVWIIEPRDPLIVRDGRPFGPDPGVRAVSLAFPFPSTTTGALRSQAGKDARGIFDPSQIERVKRIPVRGPLLVEWDTDKERWDYLASAPADALLFEADEKHPAIRRRLAPLPLEAEEFTDLPEGLTPVGMLCADPRKPKKDAPAFWRWERFAEWLTSPPDESPISNDLGHSGPTRESRIHIKFNASRGTSEDGKLFETSGLEFTHGGQDRQTLSAARHLALAVEVRDDAIPHPQPVDTLGGERRMAVWQRGELDLPLIPASLAEQIAQSGHCRLILLTPACFEKGYLPGWLRESRHGLTPQLVAAAVGRPQVVSGWDYEQKRPKPTRRLAPAGSVYFLSLGDDQEAIRKWVEATWMHCVSDDAQDQSDGFGLAVLGTWDGNPVQMQAGEEGNETA
ncbi:MAG: type III-B CRISPR module-associated protein Cmr3 [Chloroflexales bacterium]|nr:type III-B CRISPR module-associated protein Cmr3 [Chloroflexales bacterium]